MVDNVIVEVVRFALEFVVLERGCCSVVRQCERRCEQKFCVVFAARHVDDELFHDCFLL